MKSCPHLKYLGQHREVAAKQNGPHQSLFIIFRVGQVLANQIALFWSRGQFWPISMKQTNQAPVAWIKKKWRRLRWVVNINICAYFIRFWYYRDVSVFSNMCIWIHYVSKRRVPQFSGPDSIYFGWFHSFEIWTNWWTDLLTFLQKFSKMLPLISHDTLMYAVWKVYYFNLCCP